MGRGEGLGACYSGIFFCGIKAGAGFLWVEDVVTDDEGTGVAAVEVFKEGSEGCTLFGCASVGRGAVGVKASFIADADAMAVMVLHMGADNRLWSARFDAA